MEVYTRDIGGMENSMAEVDVSMEIDPTILESGKKAIRMVKEHITSTETSILAYGINTKGKDKLTTRTDTSIQVNGMQIGMMIIS